MYIIHSILTLNKYNFAYMMICSNPTNAALLFFLFTFLTASFKLCHCMRNSSIFCPEIEKQSLLNFRQSLTDPRHQLSSWGGAEVNCCKWNGVVCNNSTGHVTELHLLDYDLSGKINPSIGNLSNLQTLVLSNYGLSVDSLDWLSSLTKLEHLNMHGVNLQKVDNLAKVINSLPSLIELILSGCNLDPFMAPPDDVNVTSLTLVDLSFNSIHSLPFLSWIFQFNELLHLNFYGNKIEGTIPTITNATKLQYINLSYNNFTSSIPDSLYLCRDLVFVGLSNNRLQGTISNAIVNLTSLASLDLSSNKLYGKIPNEIAYLCKIRELKLEFNELQGEIADSFGNMWGCIQGSLESLSLNSNQLSGEIPDEVKEFKRLSYLDLGDNSFSGNLPESLGELFNLEVLDISDNKLEGVVSETNFMNLGNLTSFFASGNHLNLKVNPHWIPPFQLHYIGLGSWDLGARSQISSWLHTQKLSILELDLSNTGISGIVPEWIWGIRALNLSHNHLYGQIPSLNGPKFYLSSNQFNGSLPRITDSVFILDLSNNSISGGLSHFLCDNTYNHYQLYVLHLVKNQLSGGLPGDCLNKWPYLDYLNIGDNNMSGRIPSSIGFLRSLMSLNLFGNMFSGPIPFSLSNCTRLLKIDLARNDLDGNMPSWIGELEQLMALILHSNKFDGLIPPAICHLSNNLQYLDIGDNNMSGSIPSCIGNLTSLESLNLNGNKFSGSIPFSLRNCTKLLKIDLAHNDLDGNMPFWIGEIDFLRILILQSNRFDGLFPPEICSLNNLQILDLSDNKFSGVIPACVQNFTAMATKTSLSFDYHYYDWMKESASVGTKGIKMQYDTILPLVKNIDLSKNNLCGVIPEGFTSLVELKSLNLSQNHLTGSIPENIGDMMQLESLDFSENSLSGPIPSSLALITFLSYLNLSYNKLTGRIPQGTQLQIMSSSAFIGNNLCGPPLTSNCSGDIPRGKEDDEGKNKIEWIYVLMSLGYAVGLSAVCTALVLNKSWRAAYFGFLEETWDMLYVYVYVTWSRIMKPSISTS